MDHDELTLYFFDELREREDGAEEEQGETTEWRTNLVMGLRVHEKAASFLLLIQPFLNLLHKYKIKKI